MSWFRSKRQSPPVKRTNFADVVQAYGAVLSEAPKGLGGSIPENVLPFDKTIIKASLLEAAVQSGLSQEYLAALEVAFCSLADFQPDGGGESVFANPRMRAGQLSQDQLMEFAQKVASAGDGEMAMMNRIQREYGELMHEWHAVLAQRRSPE